MWATICWVLVLHRSHQMPFYWKNKRIRTTTFSNNITTEVEIVQLVKLKCCTPLRPQLKFWSCMNFFLVAKLFNSFRKCLIWSKRIKAAAYVNTFSWDRFVMYISLFCDVWFYFHVLCSFWCSFTVSTRGWMTVPSGLYTANYPLLWARSISFSSFHFLCLV